MFRNQPTASIFDTLQRAGMVAPVLLCITLIVLTSTSLAQNLTVLHMFTGQGDGGQPYGALTMDRAGNLYGTTSTGGAGYGSVFKLSRSGSGWILSTLYEFQGGSDGAMPQAGVVFGPDGTLYGTTTYGGDQNLGAIFNVRPPGHVCRSVQCSWEERVLYSFQGGADGTHPLYGSLTFDAAGNLYGTTVSGGMGCSAYNGCGTVFQLARSGQTWTERVILAFVNGVGQTPYSGVIFDGAGNLYGTAAFGPQSRGIVYELVPAGSGWSQLMLYNFAGGNDGAHPYGGLTFDRQGNLYGTTFDGGQQGGGVIYQLQPSGGGWTNHVLYALPQFAQPFDAPSLDDAGNLYITTSSNVVELMPGAGGWTYTDLHDFSDEEGFDPVAGVLLDSAGNLYGANPDGALRNSPCSDGCGTIWEITP